MNKYKIYLTEKNLSHCTLYPNVSNVFPIDLNSSSFVHFCKLGQLLKTDSINVEPRYWNEIISTFKASDLCFCFKEAIILIQSWDDASDSYQKLNLNGLIRVDKVALENFEINDIMLKDEVHFSFHSDDDNVPWTNSHIFLLNANWI